MPKPASPEERAQRLARLIVEEIILYNKAKIKEGIENDNLFELLSQDIAAGRRYYEDNISADLPPEVNYFDLALVDMLVKGQGATIASRIW